MKKSIFSYLIGLFIAFSPSVYAWGLGDIVDGVASGVNNVVDNVNGNEEKIADTTKSKQISENSKVNMIDLNNAVTLAGVALSGLGNNISNVDKSAVGRWSLKRLKQKKYKQVKDDEFELDASIDESYLEFIEEIKGHQHYIGETSTLVVGSKFEKYDFKKQLFPIDIMSKNSSVEFSGNGTILPKANTYGAGNLLKLVFDNTNSKYANLPMEKTRAREFIKNSKDKNGRVYRNLKTKYTFIIKKVLTPTSNIESCNEKFERCKTLGDVVLTGHITKLEIIGSGNVVLHTYDYK